MPGQRFKQVPEMYKGKPVEKLTMKEREQMFKDLGYDAPEFKKGRSVPKGFNEEPDMGSAKKKYAVGGMGTDKKPTRRKMTPDAIQNKAASLPRRMGTTPVSGAQDPRDLIAQRSASIQAMRQMPAGRKMNLLGGMGETMEAAKGGMAKKKAKVATVMKEYKAGKLKSSSGQKVTKPKQAVAIALSEAGMAKKKKAKK